MRFEKSTLEKYYLLEKLSSKQIGQKLGCSVSNINYWLTKFGIPKRKISEAIYVLKNKNGDPFTITLPKNKKESFIYGLGLGLYWGEGNKKNLNSVRLGNTDPRLISVFIMFLEKYYGVKKENLKFGLQLFNDSNVDKAFKYWRNQLGVEKSQFYKITISKIRGEGSYKNKSETGVLTVYFNNTKLKSQIISDIEKAGEM